MEQGHTFKVLSFGTTSSLFSLLKYFVNLSDITISIKIFRNSTH